MKGHVTPAGSAGSGDLTLLVVGEKSTGARLDVQ